MKARKLLIPRQVIIETTTRCNLRCKGCVINAPDALHASDMSIEAFEGILKKIDFPTTVIPWNTGEPFLTKNYNDMLMLLRNYNIRYYVTTNGHYYDEDSMFQLFGEGTPNYQLIISLDGLCTQTMTAARPGSIPEVVLRNIERFIEARKRYNAENRVDIAVKIMQRGQDYEEVENYIRYWLPKVDFVIYGRMLDQLNVESMRKYKCREFDQQFMCIRVDRSCILCAYNTKANVRPDLSYANVDNCKYSLLEAYNNDTIRNRRDAQSFGVFVEPCNDCGFAYCGDGFSGVVDFRVDPISRSLSQIHPIFFHNDYYNTFYSMKEKKKGVSYNPNLARCESCHAIFESHLDLCPACDAELY